MADTTPADTSLVLLAKTQIRTECHSRLGIVAHQEPSVENQFGLENKPQSLTPICLVIHPHPLLLSPQK